MENLPFYILPVFVITTLITLLVLYKSVNYSKSTIIITIIWLAIQSVISLSGFYTITNVMPPRFSLLLIPPVILIISLFLSKTGKQYIDTANIKILTLVHVIRIPVELVLYWLYLQKTIPEIMTYEGQNFDIICGISAPIIYYFGYVKKILNSKVLLAWNIACMLLLLNIVITALLSAPFPIQKFAFNQPNIALLYFPFTWLPGLVVPIVLFAHVASVTQLLKKKHSL